MTRATERLQVRAIPKPRRVAVVLLDMVDLERLGRLATGGARVRLVAEYLEADRFPAGQVVPASGIAVRPCALDDDGMRPTPAAPLGEP